MEDRIKALEEKVQELQARLNELQGNVPEDQLSMVVFSGDLDRVLAAMIIAVGASAMFEKVVLFFTFWGIAALRDKNKTVRKAALMPKMFAKMLPTGVDELPLSKMHMLGMGTAMLKSLMKEKNVLSLGELLKNAADFGVEIVICEMSMDLMGFSKEEMIDYPHMTVGGAAKFLGEAGKSKVTLFI